MENEFKLKKLKTYLEELGKVAVAFSAGVDSTFLLKVAHDTLGDNCIALTAKSESFPLREQSEAISFCKIEKIKLIMFDSGEIHNEDYVSNLEDRCYYCKKIFLTEMIDIAKSEGFEHVIDGTNADDRDDYRPGERAVKELNIISPLKECKFTKAEIRECARELGLSQWDKQSFACLATRIPYGERITTDNLGMVEQAEDVLANLGFKKYRVRLHSTENISNDIEKAVNGTRGVFLRNNPIARIEVAVEDIGKLADEINREKIITEFKRIGFLYITVDLEGYRTGSMNEALIL